jgi:hypothetical protein
VKTYVVLRRSCWPSVDDWREAAKQAESAIEWAPDDVRWLCSYLVAEPDGSSGTVCVYQATSPEAVRAHAARAGLPVDEIVAVAETLVVEPAIGLPPRSTAAA